MAEWKPHSKVQIAGPSDFQWEAYFWCKSIIVPSSPFNFVVKLRGSLGVGLLSQDCHKGTNVQKKWIYDFQVQVLILFLENIFS